MEKENIKEELKKVFCDQFQVREEIFEQNPDAPLTGTVFKFDAIEMTYLFFELEKRFQIEFSEEEVLQYRFNSISAIEKTVGLHVKF